MLQKNTPGVKEYGHGYHTAPDSEDRIGLGESEQVRVETASQDGTGRRERWVGDKGHKIYH